MKDHSPEDFKKLMDSSVRLWNYKLNQVVIPASSTSLERLRAFRTFISNDLHLMQLDEWRVFVNNEVPKKFRLSKKDVKATIDEITKSRQDNNTETQDEQTEEDTEEQYILNKYPEIIKDLALKILNEGDPLDFILDTWNLRHVEIELEKTVLCRLLHYKLILEVARQPSGKVGKEKATHRNRVYKLPNINT